MNYIDPWQWFHDFQARAIQDGNYQHLQLTTIYLDGWRALEAAQYEDAIHHFQEGLRHAEQLHLPMWEFFFESWVSEVLVLSADYTRALDHTTRLVAKSVKEVYQDHPVRSVVYFTLAWIYYYIDTIGYKDDILKALDALENDMPVDEETHHRSIFLRGDIELARENYELALAYNARYMQLTDGNPFRQTSGYGLQRAVAYARGDLSHAMTATRLREATSRDANLLNNAANAVLWQGVIQQYQGDSDLAALTMQRGVQEYEARNLPKKTGYYHIQAEYDLARQDAASALNHLDTALAVAIESGSLTNEFYVRLFRCYALNQLQRDVKDELTAATETANRSRKPTLFLSKLEEVRNGRTTRYNWQMTVDK